MSRKSVRQAVTLGLSAAALTAASLMAAPPANASIPLCPSDRWCLYTYYSEPERLTPVGDATVDCDGNTEVRGRVTSFVMMSHWPC